MKLLTKCLLSSFKICLSTCTRIIRKDRCTGKSKDMIISFIEYLTSTETLVDNLITIMQSRNQKMSQGGVSISTIILTLFGDKVINYKKLSSALTALSDKCSPLIKQNIIVVHSKIVTKFFQKNAT